LSQARLQSALMDDGAGLDTASLTGIARALCEEILG
jgi:hypothetical protein